MPKMSRYVLFELTKTFLLAVLSLTVTLTLVLVADEARRNGLPPGAILRILPFILPKALLYSAPVTLLLATTTVYSRMASSNEVVALKALGISPIVVLWPSYLLAIVMSLLTVWIFDVDASWGRSGLKRVFIESVQEIAYGMLNKYKSYQSQSGGFSITVKRVDDRRLIWPTLIIHRQQGNLPTMTIMAPEAELSCNHQDQSFDIILHDATVQTESPPMRVRHPETWVLSIPLAEASREDNSSTSPSWMPLRRIAKETQKQREAIEQTKEELAATAAHQMIAGQLGPCGNVDFLTSPQWRLRLAKLADMNQTLCRLLTEPFRRWASGFSCLCFIWVGAPMAVWMRNRDFLQSFFLCFAPILIVYYPLFIYGIDGAKNGTIPPYSVWAGNILLFLWGCWLLRKVLRY
jgi:lipopolysaccharide export system permease protein